MNRPRWLIGFCLLLAACAGPAVPSGTATPFVGTPRPVIIDTDMAPDDWLAVLYMLQRQDIAVKAITVVGTGEAHCGPGVQNALGLAALAGQPNIPVACGREAPLQGAHAFPDQWRTDSDRLLGLTLPANPNGPAAQSAVELILAAPAGLTLLTLGPLTNLAEALQVSPDLAQRLAAVYIMGGAVDVPGNVGVSGAGIDNSSAEWNFYADPAAVAVVLASGAPLTLVPLDATNHVPATLDFFNRLKSNRQTAEARFAFDVLNAQKDFVASGDYTFWDPLTASILADESLATFKTRALTVITSEGPDSGQLVAADAGPTVRFATTASAARFETQFLETLNAQWP
ncbi:MAG: nucleoside hydrolase [Anaerolineales bacterium]